MPTTPPHKFPGFLRPTTTPVPDEVFDLLMNELSGAELKVLLYICRRTFGFKKDSDNISLNQLINGITTKDGKVLDKGTGLSRDSVTRVIRSLESKGVIVCIRRQSREKGNEPTTYALNFLSMGDRGNRGDDGRGKDVDSPVTPESENRTRGSVEIGLELVRPSDPQQTVLQETEKQYDDVVQQTLRKFGMTKSAATKLAKTYPEDHIRDKLEFTQYLVTTGSALVRKNAAGFLRKAIEEDYAPPNEFETTTQSREREKKQTEAAAAAAEQRRVADAKYQRLKAEAKARLREQHPPQPIGQDGLTTESAWSLTLEQLKEQLPKATFETWLRNTMLLEVIGTTAQVMVPSQYVLDWIERRLYQGLARTLEGVLQQEVEIEFTVAQPLTGLGEEGVMSNTKAPVTA